MKREIKFRAWIEKHSKMVDVWQINYEGFTNKIIQSIASSMVVNENYIFQSKDFEIMQYIGLKDKTGKDIFEGDIVKWDDGSKGEYWRVAVVLLHPDIQFEIIKNTIHPLSTPYPNTFKFGNFIYTDTHNHLYVIGNIYETPNLIK